MVKERQITNLKTYQVNSSKCRKQGIKCTYLPSSMTPNLDIPGAKGFKFQNFVKYSVCQNLTPILGIHEAFMITKF